MYVSYMEDIEAVHQTQSANTRNIRAAQVESLSPSVKFVFKILELRGQLTQKDLIEETQLPPRTVRYALDRLKKSGLIEERLNIRDGRQCLYGIKTGQDDTLPEFACGFI